MREVFAEALEVAIHEQESLVRSRCEGDEPMQAEVLALLARAARSEPSAPATAPGLHMRRHSDVVAAVPEPDGLARHDRDLPERIGNCTIKRCIGEGGMGVVYEGEQQNPRRPVAVKLMRADSWSSGLASRFRQEAELLGRLEHPGIARVHQAGRARPWGSKGPELPYLVMELVDGSPLTAYATRNGLDPRQRLDLIGLVCEAMQHAHERGVVHRDLKPANVLVDAAGQPRVLDFGVARAVDAGTQGLVTLTATSQLVGTLPYMSPEQVSGTMEVGPASDIYTLGVLAYELLSGHRPVPVAGLSLAEAMRQVQHVDPPRLGGIDPRLSGDIEAIVGKALEKEPGRRYATAGAMAADIQRFLTDQPIQARPPSAIYRATKFVRRNTAVVGAVTALLLVLVAGVVATGWLALRESQARRDADKNASEARSLSYGSALASALLALDAGDASAARQHVEAAPSELREWTWRHVASRLDDATDSLEVGLPQRARNGQLVSRADGRLVVPLLASLVVVRASGDRLQLERRLGGTFLAVSLDGRRALEVAGGRWIDRAIDASDEAGSTDTNPGLPASIDLGPVGGPLGEFTPKQEGELVALPMPEGGWTLTRAGNGPEARTDVHDRTGRLLATLPMSLDGISALSPDGRTLASNHEQRLVLAATTPGGRLIELGGRASALAFTPDGKRLLGTAGHGKCHSWDVETATPGPWSDIQVASVLVHLLVPTPSSAKFITVDQRGQARLWRTADGSLEQDLAEVGYLGHSLALSPDGRHLALATASGSLRLMDLRDRSAGAVLIGPRATVHSVTFLTGEMRLACIDEKGSLRLFVDPARRGSARLPGHGSFVYDVAVDAQDRVASVAWDGTARVWDAQTGTLIRTIALPDRVGRIITLLEDGTLVAAMHQSTVAWDVQTGEELGRMPGEQPVRSLASGAPAGRAVYGAEDGTIGWWNPRTGEHANIASVGTSDSEIRIALSASKSRLAWARSQSVGVLDASSGATLWQAHVPCDRVLGLDIDPEGKRVAAACRDGSLYLLDGTVRRQLDVPGGSRLFAVRFHPHEPLLATGAQDGSITTWDLARGVKIAQLRDHRDYVHGLAFSPDGTFLASASADATVGIWSTRSVAQLATERPAL